MISKMYYYILVIKKYIYVSPQENLFNIGGEYFLLNRFYESFIYIYINFPRYIIILCLKVKSISTFLFKKICLRSSDIINLFNIECGYFLLGI